jgi:hypothetical protein
VPRARIASDLHQAKSSHVALPPLRIRTNSSDLSYWWMKFRVVGWVGVDRGRLVLGDFSDLALAPKE